MALFDRIAQIAAVVSSSLQKSPDTDKTVDVLFHVEGVDGLDDDGEPEGDEEGIYGALGVISRPLKPDTDGKNAEVVCLRTADGLVPIASKDTRLRMVGNAPHEGTVALVGYGGGFHSMDPVNTEDTTEGTIHVIYCPYDPDSDGVPQKAHSITLDPTSGNESISIVHAEGMAITMASNKEVVIKNSDGSATITMDDSGITITGQLNVVGGLVVGNPTTAVPLLAGPASPPCSTLFVSP